MINSIFFTEKDILIEDLPQLLYETFKSLLKQKRGLKVRVYLWLFYGVSKDQEEKAIISKNKYILNKDYLKFIIFFIEPNKK
jgi:hypothetical protein